jgi:formylglycine-generating enzyme required for sulfatase activity
VGLVQESHADDRAPAGKARAGCLESPAEKRCVAPFARLAPIPAGNFVMGSPPDEPGRFPDEVQVPVRLTDSFWMMESEVTQRMWRSLMGRRKGWHARRCGSACPADTVTWHDAVRFANAASEREGLRVAYRIDGESVTWDPTSNGYRLPTEAEWEYAARGGEGYVYAGSNQVDSVAWYDENSGFTTSAVCGLARNGYGLCDMSGNVWEWTWDAWDSAPTGGTDPAGAASSSYRVARGGCYDNDPRFVRVAMRTGFDPGFRYSGLGFRLVRARGAASLGDGGPVPLR